MLFSSLLGAQRLPTEVVVTLLAVLELVRLGSIRVQQTELFGDIVIERRPHDPATSSAGFAGAMEKGEVSEGAITAPSDGSEDNRAHTD